MTSPNYVSVISVWSWYIVLSPTVAPPWKDHTAVITTDSGVFKAMLFPNHLLAQCGTEFEHYPILWISPYRKTPEEEDPAFIVVFVVETLMKEQVHHCARLDLVIAVSVASLPNFNYAILSAQIFFHHRCGDQDRVLLLVYAVSISKGHVSREMYYCYNLKGRRKGMNIWWKSGGRHYPSLPRPVM